MARIIVAEDQTHIRHVLTMWLTRHGHEVVQAATGRAALTALRAGPADLLITDVNMPEVDGIELARTGFSVCAALRQIFIVTARCDLREIRELLADTRVRVFPKPFSPSQLLREVEAAVGAGAGGTLEQEPAAPAFVSRFQGDPA